MEPWKGRFDRHRKRHLTLPGQPQETIETQPSYCWNTETVCWSCLPQSPVRLEPIYKGLRSALMSSVPRCRIQSGCDLMRERTTHASIAFARLTTMNGRKSFSEVRRRRSSTTSVTSNTTWLRDRAMTVPARPISLRPEITHQFRKGLSIAIMVFPVREISDMFSIADECTPPHFGLFDSII